MESLDNFQSLLCMSTVTAVFHYVEEAIKPMDKLIDVTS